MTIESEAEAAEALISAWRSLSAKPPFVLPGDKELLSANPNLTVLHGSFASYCEDEYFGLNDGRLHVGLIPSPYIGNLRHASIFVLMLNPGLSPGDYLAEERFPDFRRMLFSDLFQREGSKFHALEPSLSWHPGGQYWLGRFRELAKELVPDFGSFKGALAVLSDRVAGLELVPYHSANFGLPWKVVEELESVRLMRSFVIRNLLPRAMRGEILVIVTRQAQRWGLQNTDQIVVYDRTLARGGHISPGTPGGDAILSFLRR